MKRSLLYLIVGFAAGALVFGTAVGWWMSSGASRSAAEPMHVGHDTGGAADRPSTTRFQCPMHPEYVSDMPGDCPICDMRLVPMEEPAAAPIEPERRVIYRSTMNPGEVADHPGVDSMGMEMVPVEVESPETAPAVPGYVPVNLPAHKQQFIGVQTAPIERRSLGAEVRTVGRVDYDETALSWVNTKIAGWIEVLHVDRTGQFVTKGQRLIEIYSPELVATQEELLVARENLQRLEQSGALPTAVSQARALLEDSRRRLALWDVAEDQIHALETSGLVTRRVALVAPEAGFVVEKTALQGKYVMPGENLYRIAGLSQVWVLAKVYEQDIPRIEVGQRADLDLSYAPGRSYGGRVDYVYPYLDPTTRTVDVRLVVRNDDLTLRPEMYANVRFAVPAAKPVLAAPNEAILDTGERQIAFVKRDQGTFEPRVLRVGLRTREFTEVIEGLAEGEEVVISGNFLIDSESRLKAALAGMGTGASGHKHGG